MSRHPFMVAMLLFAATAAHANEAARSELATAQAALDAKRGEDALRHLARTEQLLGGTAMRIVVARIQALGLLGRHRELLAAVEAYKLLGPEPTLAIHGQILELERQATQADQRAASMLASLQQRHVQLRGAVATRRVAELGVLIAQLDELAQKHPHVRAADQARALRVRLAEERCGAEYEILDDKTRETLRDFRSGGYHAVQLVAQYRGLPARGCKSSATAARQIAALERHAADTKALEKLKGAARGAEDSYRRAATTSTDLRTKLEIQRSYARELAATTLRAEILRDHVAGGGDRSEAERRVRELEQQLVVLEQTERTNRRDAINREADYLERFARRDRRKALWISGGAVVGLASGLTIMIAKPFDRPALDLPIGGVIASMGLGFVFALPNAITTAKASSQRANERRRDARRVQLLWSPREPLVIGIGGTL